MITKPLIGLHGQASSLYPEEEFVTEWNLPSGNFTFPTQNVAGTWDGEINFSDGGGWKTVTAYNDANLTNNYASGGTYQIRIRGDFLTMYLNNSASIKTYLTKIIQWGTVGFNIMARMFYGASNLTEIPSGRITIDDASLITNCQYMFANCGITSYPDELLYNLTNLNNASFMFQNGLFTSLSNNFLSQNVNITTLERIFYLSNLQNFVSIDNNTLVTSLFGMYWSADLQGNIPAGYIDNNDQVTNLGYMLLQQSGLTGTSGEFWLNPSGAANYTLTGPDYDSGIPSGLNCYFNCSGLSDYGSIPTYWK